MTRPIGTTAEGTVHDDLQATVVELIELSLQGKQAHWNVTGPLFRSVHLELDEIVETARWAPTRSPSDGHHRCCARRSIGDDQPRTARSSRFAAGIISTERGGRKRSGSPAARSSAGGWRAYRAAGRSDPISEGILIEVAENGSRSTPGCSAPSAPDDPARYRVRGRPCGAHETAQPRGAVAVRAWDGGECRERARNATRGS
jgi:starvation-inducible DNA-binding protein